MKRNRNIDGFMQKSAMLLMGLLLLASCGSKRSSVAESSVSPLPTDAKAVDEALLVRVNSNSVNEQNIVGSMKFSLNMNGRNISAPGSLHMRRNEIIRLQVFVPLLGSEVGRVDFTPTKVLLVDRLHKEYIEADYTTISFLKNNNIDFYTLQSLFWNQLLVPGSDKVTESDLQRFTLNGYKTAGRLDIALESGKLNYEWSADRLSCLIQQALLTYESATRGKSEMKCTYSDFTKLGKKQFPLSIVFNMHTKATGKERNATMTIKLNDVSNDSKWDATTTLSNKYEKIESSDLFDKLLKM